MFQYKIKLSCLYFIVGCSTIATRVLCCSLVNEHFETANNNVQGSMWNVKSDGLAVTKKVNAQPYINIITGNSKEWSNVRQSGLSKRSEDPIGSPFLNPPIINDLRALNMSDPISKYHCPINLLYGNNLTVKNYFLLMSHNNSSSNHLPQQPDEEIIENLFTPSVITSTNDTDSLSRTEILSNKGMGEPSMNIDDLMTTTTEESNMESQWTLNPIETGSETTMLGESLVNIGILTKSSEMVPGPTTFEILVTPGVSEESTLESGNGFAIFETYSTASLEGVNQTTLTKEIIVSKNHGDSSVKNTRSTIPDFRYDIMRTIDKYCETFNISEGGMYTLLPDGTEQQINHNLILNDQSKMKQPLLGEKRTVKKRNLRKHFKLPLLVYKNN